MYLRLESATIDSPVWDRVAVNPYLEVTLAQQLRQQILWLIASGQIGSGERLPSVRAMARRLGINMLTVRSAYQRLEADGLVETRQGWGTRVLPYDAVRIARTAGAARTHSVGVILPSSGNPFYQAFLQGIEEIAGQYQYLLFVCNAHDDHEEAWSYFAQLSTRQVDGIIVASLDVNPLLQVEGAGGPALPVVSFDWPATSGYSVMIDLENAGYAATRHLLEHGHRRIGLITFAQDVANVVPVNEGYWRALNEAGIEPEAELVARVQGFGTAAGAEGAGSLLALPKPPTAIFAIADMLALGVMQALKARRLRIPDDVAVASFNDIPLAALVEPALTTVLAPAREAGVEAMTMLQCLIEGRQPSRRKVLLPTSLVVRDSCGPHP